MLFERMRLPLGIAIALTVAGCATVAGTPAPGEIDVRTLDVGKYSTEPLDTYDEFIHSLKSGATLAAMRLSDQVVIGLDFDPTLKYGSGVHEVADVIDPPSTGLTDLDEIMSTASADVAERHQALFGFASGSSDTPPIAFSKNQAPGTRVTITVLQFGDTATAATAAREMDSADFDVAKDQNESVVLQKYPAAHAHWRPGTPTLGATIAHGQYVVNVFAATIEADRTKLTDLVEKTLAAQLPMLDALPPLSAEQVLRLEPDMDMIRRNLTTLKSNHPSMTIQAAFGLRGFLHWQTDREEARQLYSEARADRFAVSEAYTTSFDLAQGIASSFGSGQPRSLNGGFIARAGDEDAARVLWTKILDAPDASKAPTGLPNTKCAQQESRGSVNEFACALRYGKFVGLVWSSQLIDAQQRASAQYALLANSY
ncbi:DUF7373 family lipoprotein [Nocardia huaxiensis]|uniref:DUF7373 family lipoprotein n=1 Tax=Nocardia huaxiensis TaxID=2755382 RepID=UPI001E556A7F|nr:hypothetical protein [Nocardia huaxiensis]UFS95475.1 hypothetical protein LPY97_33170 [Nocardia huaxiensis]